MLQAYTGNIEKLKEEREEKRKEERRKRDDKIAEMKKLKEEDRKTHTRPHKAITYFVDHAVGNMSFCKEDVEAMLIAYLSMRHHNVAEHFGLENPAKMLLGLHRDPDKVKSMIHEAQKEIKKIEEGDKKKAEKPKNQARLKADKALLKDLPAVINADLHVPESGVVAEHLRKCVELGEDVLTNQRPAKLFVTYTLLIHAFELFIDPVEKILLEEGDIKEVETKINAAWTNFESKFKKLADEKHILIPSVKQDGSGNPYLEYDKQPHSKHVDWNKGKFKERYDEFMKDLASVKHNLIWFLGCEKWPTKPSE